MISIHSKYGLASKHASLAAGVSISSCWGVASPSSPLNSALYLDFPRAAPSVPLLCPSLLYS